MRVVHGGTDETGKTGETLADEVEVADSLLAKMTGLRFRRSFPEGRALVFPFDSVGRRDVDMLFVPFPIDVLWLVGERVERVETLRPWIGVGITRADTVIELPAGRAAGVSEGDAVRVEGRSAD